MMSIQINKEQKILNDILEQPTWNIRLQEANSYYPQFLDGLTTPQMIELRNALLNLDLSSPSLPLE